MPNERRCRHARTVAWAFKQGKQDEARINRRIAPAWELGFLGEATTWRDRVLYVLKKKALECQSSHSTLRTFMAVEWCPTKIAGFRGSDVMKPKYITHSVIQLDCHSGTFA